MEYLSNCCSAKVLRDTCMSCKEHCEAIPERMEITQWNVRVKNGIRESDWIRDSEGNTVCCLLGDHPNEEAHSHLIGAAPDLLFQLEDILEQVNDFPHLRKGVNMKEARKAISRARGVDPELDTPISELEGKAHVSDINPEDIPL